MAPRNTNVLHQDISAYLTSPEGKDYSCQKIIIGTHTSDLEPNFLMVAEVKLPKEETLMDVSEFQ